MDESIEETSANNDCCVGCLTKDENKLSNANASGLLKDFLNREVFCLHFCLGCEINNFFLLFCLVDTFVQTHSGTSLH